MIYTSLSKHFRLILCAVAVASFFPVLVSAQSVVSYTVSPTIFDMTANPGQSWQSTIRVINANSFELPLYIEIVNFAPKGETGAPQFFPVTADTEPNSTIAQWITTEREVTLPPERTIELPLQISVPTGASPGGHFAAVMISTKPGASVAQESQVQTSQIISSLIFLRVTGDITESSSIRSFRTSNYLLSKPETTFELRVENKGNVHVQPQGEIKIYNMWGQERGSIPVNQQTLFGNVLPKSVRKYSFTWNSEWSVTDIGRYTALTTLGYGVDEKQFMTADTAFWIIPWKILLVVFAILASFVALVSWAIKLYVRKMLALAGVAPGMQPLSPVAAAADRASKKSSLVMLQSTKTALTKGKPLRLAAPLEAGLLDLRSRLSLTAGLKQRLLAAYAFGKEYWKFFMTLLGVIIFVAIFTWFLRGALTPERDFEVTIENENNSVTVQREEGKTDIQNDATATGTGAAESTVPISVINRSGSEVRLKEIVETVANAGYNVATTSTDEGSIEQKTVIVYKSDVSSTALALSRLLDNALLSAFVEGSNSSDSIVIYVGSDMIE